MKNAEVVFSDMRADPRRNQLQKVEQLLEAAGIAGCVKKNDLVAVKIHFGELGNTAFIRPVFVRRVVELIKRLGGKPFVTDANTLYAGTRSDTVSHLETAIANGFGYSSIGAPLVIADGIRGQSDIDVPIDGIHLKTVSIAREIAEADAIVALTHFKGHELTGLGGSLKNIGMGCAAKRGKMVQHSSVSPKVTRKKCITCGQCSAHCAHSAIDVDEKAFIDPARCVGCGECVSVCPVQAIQVQWNESPNAIQEKMAEHVAGALKGKEGKAMFLNFLTQISPACDCWGHSDAPIVADIGYIASTDPVAADQAGIDLVNQSAGREDSALKVNLLPGEDKLKGIYPQIDWAAQLIHAEKIGIGTRAYSMRKI